MGKLVDADEVLAMFCGDCAFRGEPEGSAICKGCDYKNRIESVQERHQQRGRSPPPPQHQQHQSVKYEK